MFNWYSVDSWVPKCAKKISPTTLHQTKQGRMAAFVFLYQIHQTGQRLSSLLLPLLVTEYELQWHPVWSFVAAAHFQRCSSADFGCDDGLSELVSPSCQLQGNAAFSQRNLPLTGCSLSFGSFSVNPREGCGKIPADQLLLKYSDKTLKNLSSPVMLSLNVSRSAFLWLLYTLYPPSHGWKRWYEVLEADKNTFKKNLLYSIFR